MRFLFFNIVVGAALVFLYNGGDIDLSRFSSAVKSVPQIVAANEPAVPNPSSGHARDVIEEPAKPIVKKPAPKPEPPKAIAPAPLPAATTVVSKSPIAPPPLPPIEKAVTVAKYEPKKPVFGNPETDRRRAEILQEAEPPSSLQKFALKEGSSLMTITERRQALDNLAEEMEMLFLEKIGG